jgi:hypothetical protein
VEVVEVVVVMVVEGDSYEVTRPRAIDKQGRTLMMSCPCEVIFMNEHLTCVTCIVSR